MLLNPVNVSCTTAIGKPYPFIVPLKARESGLPRDCCVNLAQIATVDKSHLVDKCGELDEQKMKQIDQAIKISLAIK